ncbi:PA2169 family four-helix-bundle protein [Anatilimnocola floriformis]|uniref:PA2169 family four-helix-bundle protein n=1 Tax=Anatilimnocola floriformis TaxID=2948575 RepID=UPI0020C54311|nr:PA2169 family four-helix-bundle protein [Anatilimnocola floriformis]
MAMTTNTLCQKSIDWLQSLTQINIDSRDGFKEAAENLKETNPTLANRFRQWASNRDGQASELQTMVAANAETPTKSGSVAAAAHRTWMDIRSALGGGEQAILDESERGEDQIKAKYEEALKDLGGAEPCCDTLRRHLAAVQVSHDEVKALRDSHHRPGKAR